VAVPVSYSSRKRKRMPVSHDGADGLRAHAGVDAQDAGLADDLFDDGGEDVLVHFLDASARGAPRWRGSARFQLRKPPEPRRSKRRLRGERTLPPATTYTPGSALAARAQAWLSAADASSPSSGRSRTR
jgi:hypothetical protein